MTLSILNTLKPEAVAPLLERATAKHRISTVVPAVALAVLCPASTFGSIVSTAIVCLSAVSYYPQIILRIATHRKIAVVAGALLFGYAILPSLLSFETILVGKTFWVVSGLYALLNSKSYASIVANRISVVAAVAFVCLNMLQANLHLLAISCYVVGGLCNAFATLDSLNEVLREVHNQFVLSAEFESSLSQWVLDPSATGNKDSASAAIRNEFYREPDYDHPYQRYYALDDVLHLRPLANNNMLNLAGLGLNSLPSALFSCTSTKKIFLVSNNFTTIPPVLERMAWITDLEFNNNLLGEIPDRISALCNLERLILDNNQITTISEQLWNCKKLKILSVQNNRLVSLPNLVNSPLGLLILNLSKNSITTIPNGINILNRLKVLELGSNQIGTISDQLCNCTDLIRVNLSHNRLISLPDSVNRLMHLKSLNLDGNQPTYLPNALGELSQLESLSLERNPNLTQLPLSLDRTNLSEIFTDQTQISQGSVAAILNSCRGRRDERSASELPNRIELLKQCAKSASNREFDLEFIFEMDNPILVQINEWLFRLSKTKEFERNQAALALRVCEMLASLEDYEAFKKAFLIQISVNNENCSDRAAMAFNELFVAWVIHTLNKEASVQTNLNLLMGCARTEALRNNLGAQIVRQQINTGTILEESVQIYLCYETEYKKELKLVTAIESMHYRQIGKRDWIDLTELKNAVRDNAFACLLKQPSLLTVAEGDTDFIQKRDAITAAFAKKQTKLEAKFMPDSDDEKDVEENEAEDEDNSKLTYLEQSNKLKKDRADALEKLLVDWTKARLS